VVCEVEYTVGRQQQVGERMPPRHTRCQPI
jgi:hypothetical protein